MPLAHACCVHVFVLAYLQVPFPGQDFFGHPSEERSRYQSFGTALLSEDLGIVWAPSSVVGTTDVIAAFPQPVNALFLDIAMNLFPSAISSLQVSSLAECG
jgi:hypothetical protein